MKKGDRYSRLNPVYLFRRHAGTVFLFLALGLLAGVAYYALLQPAHYSATAETAVTAAPSGQAESVDWRAKRASWNAFLASPRARGLLGGNLRHALKLAVTVDQPLRPERFPAALAAFGEGKPYSASLFLNPYAARLGPGIMATRRNLAENIDFQSLAAILADCNPPADAEGWDFSFFAAFLPQTPEEDAIGREDWENPYLRVLFTLHRLRGGSAEADLEDVWRSAQEELSGRLTREAQFAGGGGFGDTAKRELLRELAAIPVLAANSLYEAKMWYRGDPPLWAEGMELEVEEQTPGRAVARVRTGIDLLPLRFPRDTVFTRVPPLAAATLLATIAAHERSAAAPVSAPESPAPAAAPEPEPGPAVDAAHETPSEEASGDAAPPAETITYREEIDEAANALRLDRIAAAEDALRLAQRDRDARLRRLAAAREDENRLSLETMYARKRADAFRARYDQAAQAAEESRDPELPGETRRLLLRRDQATRRLNALLAYCTDEHPFVKAAFHELRTLEAALAAQAPGAAENRLAERRAERAANLRTEWEDAGASADALEERRVRQAEAVSLLAGEAEAFERTIAEREAELAEAKRAPIPTRRVEIRIAPPAEAPETPAETPARPAPAQAPGPKPAPSPAPVGAPEPGSAAPGMEFSPVPADIPLHVAPRPRRAIWISLLGGLLAGVLVSAVREMLSRRFANPSEARRLTKLPVLASLPAYDPLSFKKAASTVKGDLAVKKSGAIHFIPTAVELFEPPAEARRGRVTPLRRRPRILARLCGALLILASAMLYYLSLGGFAQPRAAFRGELPLPAATVPAWTEERGGAKDWGNMP